MRASSLTEHHPKLEGVFGTLSMSQDEYLRRVLDQVDGELGRIAGHVGNTAGLEMQWYESGQLFISGYVTAGDAESHAATFMVELWPSWVHGEPVGKSEWVVETSIDVDCQHVIDHEVWRTSSVGKDANRRRKAPSVSYWMPPDNWHPSPSTIRSTTGCRRPRTNRVRRGGP